MLQDRISRLYQKEGLSSSEIATKLDLTVWQVIKRMKKYDIPRRKQWETRRIQFDRQKPSYKMKAHLTAREKGLYIAAIMLYWAEGAKRTDHCVDFANSDEKMIMLFLDFLRKICRVDESKLRVLLYCYSNQEVTDLISYWSRLLRIPKNQFIKPFVRRDFDQGRVNRMEKGLVHIRYHDKKLLMHIKAKIDTISKELVSRDGRVDKRTSL